MPPARNAGPGAGANTHFTQHRGAYRFCCARRFPAQSGPIRRTAFAASRQRWPTPGRKCQRGCGRRPVCGLCSRSAGSVRRRFYAWRRRVINQGAQPRGKVDRPKRKFKPTWPSAVADTPERRNRVTRERQAKLDEKAKALGFKSFSELATAWLKGQVEIVKLT